MEIGDPWMAILVFAWSQLFCVAFSELLNVSVCRSLGMVLTGKNVDRIAGRRVFSFGESACGMSLRESKFFIVAGIGVERHGLRLGWAHSGL
jgi:hypothetical protein